MIVKNKFLQTIEKSDFEIKTVLLLILIFNTVSAYGQDLGQTNTIHDGNTLKGWKSLPETNQSLWQIKDGVIIGGDGISKIPENNYLYTENPFEDFEFRCLFRLSGNSDTGMINSGIQYRSQIQDGNMVGYQADIGNGYWGDIYDEHRRGKLVGGDLSTVKHLLKEDGWNSYIIRCKDNHHELFINGVKTSEYTEKNSDIPANGIIGIQLHSGGAAKVEFRDLTITELN